MKDLKFSFAEATLAIKPDHLEKLVSELVDNACKFSHAGQAVRACGEVRDDNYVLTITDQGRGMTPEEIESLGPMVQVDRVRVMQGGVGLGFAISRALATRYGGTVKVQPNGNHGLVIEVTLPIAK
jgi:signal transduction histidine kinase